MKYCTLYDREKMYIIFYVFEISRDYSFKYYIRKTRSSFFKLSRDNEKEFALCF